MLAAASAVAAATAQTTAPVPDGYPAPGTPAVVRLLAPGSAPRARLRYAVPSDFRQRGRFTTSMSMTMTSQGMTMPAVEVPAMTMDLDFAVTGVAENGDISYSVASGGIDVEGTGPMVDAMRNGLQQLEGFRGTAVMTNRGATRSLALDASDMNNPQLKEIMGSLSQSIQSMSLVLPEEPVGVGARWEIRQAMALNVVQTYQRLEVELRAVDGPNITLRATSEQLAPRQLVSDPRLPPGAELMLQDVSGNGTGTLMLRLTELIPKGEVNSQSSTAMEVRFNGGSQPINTDASVRIVIAPAD
jgi:hypothetical protein